MPMEMFSRNGNTHPHINISTITHYNNNSVQIELPSRTQYGKL